MFLILVLDGSYSTNELRMAEVTQSCTEDHGTRVLIPKALKAEVI